MREKQVKKVPNDEKSSTADLGKVKEKKKKAKSRLTDSVIYKLQNYFGIPLGNKVGNVKVMKNAKLVSMFHVASSEDYDIHIVQKHQIRGANMAETWPITQICINQVPVDVIVAIKPICYDLTKASELEKCLHGLTQNCKF